MNVSVSNAGRYTHTNRSSRNNFVTALFSGRTVGGQTIVQVPVRYRISPNFTSEQFIAPVESVFESDPVALDVRSSISGHELGSVHYRKGIRRHDYNGIYHAKVEGSVAFHSRPAKDDNDARYPIYSGTDVYGNAGTPAVIWIDGNGGAAGLGEWELETPHFNHSGSFMTFGGDVTDKLVGYANTPEGRVPCYLFFRYIWDCQPQAWSGRLDCIAYKAVYHTFVATAPTPNGIIYYQDNVGNVFDSGPTLGYWESKLPIQIASQQPGLTSDVSRVLRDWQNYGWVDERVDYSAIREAAYRVAAAAKGAVQRNYWPNPSVDKNCRWPVVQYWDAIGGANRETTQRALQGLASALERDYLNHPPVGAINFNDLAYRAYQDIGMWDGNGLLYVSDAAKLTSQTRDFVRTAKSLVKNVKKARIVPALKDASKEFLSIFYGYRLSFRDTKDLLQVLRSPSRNAGTQRCQASTEGSAEDELLRTWSYEARYQCYYNTASVEDNLTEFLYYLDLVPDLENIWDMVPYSFVIDWFIKIGDLLASIDNFYQISSRYDVEAAGQSVKVSRRLTPKDFWFLGTDMDVDAVFSIYRRGYTPNPLVPVPSKLGNPTNPFTHSVEAGALIISR